MKDLAQLIVRSARAALSLIDGEDGSMPAGHNGPYHDPETPVRNTSHWLLTFLKAYKLSGDTHFLHAANKVVSYLCGTEARPMEAAFWHRKNPAKDFCNGLIGQAWTIEALAVAAKSLDDEDCQMLAEQVFLLHPFREDLGLWQRVNVDGSHSSIDGTFNHQLWFAAAGALLLPALDERVKERVTPFLSLMSRNMRLYPSGLIRHPLRTKSGMAGMLHTLSRTVRWMLQGRSLRLHRQRMHHKSIGYHAFNLYGLALLKQAIPDHAFWDSNQMRRVLKYIETDEYSEGLEQNKYGYPYNPPGFEVAFALGTFVKKSTGEQERWVSRQLARCYNCDTHLMTRNTSDPATHAARLYEATRLPDMNVSLGAEE